MKNWIGNNRTKAELNKIALNEEFGFLLELTKKLFIGTYGNNRFHISVEISNECILKLY